MDASQPLVSPAAVRLVEPQWAERVVSPSLGVDRDALMARDSMVFLHVSRPDPALGPDAGSIALTRLIAAGAYGPVLAPALYLYRLRTPDHEQVAVVGDVSAGAMGDGRVLPHERIRTDRADALATDLDRLGVDTVPVALGYPDDPAVDAIVGRACTGRPLLDFRREDDLLRQTVWALEPEDADRLVEQFASAHLVIIDGHHRMAAAGIRRGAPRVLAAIFPFSQLRAGTFHRRVVDLAGRSAAELRLAVAEQGFEVVPTEHATVPALDRPGIVGMYVDGRWDELRPSGAVSQPARAADTDAARLAHRVLGPLLGVDDNLAAGRLELIADALGIAALTGAVDDRGGVGFALAPTPLTSVLEIAEAGEVMPPKSTHFLPKVRAGVFLAPR